MANFISNLLVGKKILKKRAADEAEIAELHRSLVRRIEAAEQKQETLFQERQAREMSRSQEIPQDG